MSRDRLPALALAALFLAAARCQGNTLELMPRILVTLPAGLEMESKVNLTVYMDSVSALVQASFAAKTDSIRIPGRLSIRMAKEAGENYLGSQKPNRVFEIANVESYIPFITLTDSMKAKIGKTSSGNERIIRWWAGNSIYDIAAFRIVQAKGESIGQVYLTFFNIYHGTTGKVPGDFSEAYVLTLDNQDRTAKVYRLLDNFVDSLIVKQQ